MNYPGGRMPIWKSQDNIRREWLYVFSGADAIACVLTLIGRAEGAANKLLPVPMGVWAIFVLMASVALLFGYSKTGALLGAAMWGGITGTSLLAVANRTALWDAGWVGFGVLFVCHLAIYREVHSGMDADREWRQRRG